MKKLDITFLLYTIILIEGYVVLSSELIAMRQTIAYVGSGTDTVSIIIAAVLMPLAIGYQRGGSFKQGRFLGRYLTIRRKLIFNIIAANLILLPGLSYFTLKFFFYYLNTIDISHRVFQTFIYAGVFIVIPVYLLGQTIPLVSNYFSKQKLSEITGRMLCLSTVGSFLGAVFSTLFLMDAIGVNNTVSLIFVLLTILVILLSKNKTSETVIFSFALVCTALILNSNALMIQNQIVVSNKYSDIGILIDPDTGNRHMIQNGNDSSMYNDSGEKHEYAQFIERMAIKPIDESIPPKKILVVGAAGFTLGHEDTHNNYVYVDLDGDLDEIAEKYILKKKIGPNKEFKVMDVRAYLRSHPENKFDVIVMDAYNGGLSIPESLVTREYFLQLKSALSENGLLFANFIVSPNFNNTFSKSIDNTFRSVFPYISRHVIKDDYQLWEESKTNSVNAIYIYRNESEDEYGSIFVEK